MQTDSSTHTPGEWTVGKHRMDASRYIYSDDSPRAVACAMSGGVGREPAEIHANARLIAAAPDLLEACERVDRLMSWKDIPASMVEVDLVREQLRAAIAKARGGEGGGA